MFQLFPLSFLNEMRRFLLLALLLPLAACDSSTPGEEGTLGPSLPTVVAQASAALSSSDASPFTLGLDQRGNAKTAQAGSSEALPYVLDSSDLWVSGTQGGTLRAAAALGRSSYAPCDDGTGGVFHLFADTTYSAAGWPVANGAPVDASGAPRVYGDEMLWTTTCQNSADAPSLTLFDGLRTNVALFRAASVPNTVFARYEITNTSAGPMTDVTVGLRADPDLSVGQSTGYAFDVYDNLVGFDPASNLAYVYFDQLLDGTSRDGNGPRRTDAQRGRVAGVTLLGSPGNAGLTVHRVMSKRGEFASLSRYEEPPYDVTPTGIAEPLHALYRDGTAQIDWTTGLPTQFALTGDPVAMTGWLDGMGPFKRTGSPQDVQDGRDVRLLIASGPSSLAPGESAAFTIAWATAREPTLAAALGALRERASLLRSTPSLWRF